MGMPRGEYDFGIAGLGVMGLNLALNIEEHGFSVAVWNRTREKTERFISEHAGKHFLGAETLEEFAAALKRPRRIMLVVKAGEPVSAVIAALKPLLEPGDILIDGGNSWFKDTQRRADALAEGGLHFFGVGVSGGEEGARFGPSLMPGGPAEAYDRVSPVLEAIAAKTSSGPCVSYIGPGGAGHFVKMVHNGIEYGDMQLIAEAYDILRKAAGLRAEQLAEVFAEWNRGPLESFLMELTARIFTVRDEETGRPLVELVLDEAAQKGTGGWAVQGALELGVPVPTIAAAVDARLLSAMKAERVAAGTPVFKAAKAGRPSIGTRDLITAVHDALHGAKICCYAQGMSLIRTASRTYDWDVDPKEIARIWKGGCIIRARLLDSIIDAYHSSPRAANLLLDERLGGRVSASEAGWRRALNAAQTIGIPAPAMCAALAYFDAYRSLDLPQSLIQAQRDAFGAHTYKRIDKPEIGPVHTDWQHGGSTAAAGGQSRRGTPG